MMIAVPQQRTFRGRLQGLPQRNGLGGEVTLKSVGWAKANLRKGLFSAKAAATSCVPNRFSLTHHDARLQLTSFPECHLRYPWTRTPPSNSPSSAILRMPLEGDLSWKRHSGAFLKKRRRRSHCHFGWSLRFSHVLLAGFQRSLQPCGKVVKILRGSFLFWVFTMWARFCN